jgi:hypothetical protein
MDITKSQGNMMWIAIQQSNNLHKWDSIQYESKSVFIKFLAKLFSSCKTYVHFLNNLKFFYFPKVIIFPIYFIFFHFCDVTQWSSAINNFSHI